MVDGRAVCEGEDGDGRAGIMIPEMTRIERAWGKRGGERSRIHLDDDISTLTTYLGTYPVSFILVLV